MFLFRERERERQDIEHHRKRTKRRIGKEMMSVQNYYTSYCNSKKDGGEPLPGFRFHPTDEELVGFYLRRKVEKKLPPGVDFIKQIDIYKYNPWDLPKPSSTVGENELYFFCQRGRKYRNSIRPNRVTGSGFWKATGIDKPLYSSRGSHECVGLKKTLVYYRGSAGKGNKTEWMMHEFRLPPLNNDNGILGTNKIPSSDKLIETQEAEVWTICRIFKRNVSHKKFTLDHWKQVAAAAKCHSLSKEAADAGSKTCSSSVESINNHETYITFGPPVDYDDQKPLVNNLNHKNGIISQWCGEQLAAGTLTQEPLSMASASSSFPDSASFNEFFTYGNWDELGSVVEFALDPSLE